MKKNRFSAKMISMTLILVLVADIVLSPLLGGGEAEAAEATLDPQTSWEKSTGGTYRAELEAAKTSAAEKVEALKTARTAYSKAVSAYRTALDEYNTAVTAFNDAVEKFVLEGGDPAGRDELREDQAVVSAYELYSDAKKALDDADAAVKKAQGDYETAKLAGDAALAAWRNAGFWADTSRLQISKPVIKGSDGTETALSEDNTTFVSGLGRKINIAGAEVLPRTVEAGEDGEAVSVAAYAYDSGVVSGEQANIETVFEKETELSDDAKEVLTAIGEDGISLALLESDTTVSVSDGDTSASVSGGDLSSGENLSVSGGDASVKMRAVSVSASAEENTAAHLGEDTVSGGDASVSGGDAGDYAAPGLLRTYADTGIALLSADEPVDGADAVSGDLYYTIEYDQVLAGYYRQYYVWNANQLSYLLKCYSTASDIRAVASETGDRKVGVAKLGIVLLCDIDLGGGSMEAWPGYRNASWYLEIDGGGNSIYNGYFPDFSSAFLGVLTVNQTTGATTLSADSKFAIENLTFSHMYMDREYGLFGGVFYAFFENVDCTDCLAYSESGSSVSVLLGMSYSYLFMKNCTIRDSYVYGGAHTSLFASYNNIYGNSVNSANNINHSYLGDRSDGDVNGYYFTDISSELFTFEILEAIVRSKKIYYRDASDFSLTVPDGEEAAQYTYPLASTYLPNIMYNCAAIDNEVYIRGSGSNHSGGFVSCMQGGMIFKDCFSNTTMYCNTQGGIFTGACIGSSDGFYYELDGEKTLVSDLFENCYTSGVLEGNNRLGGFVGMIFDDVRALQSNSRGVCIFKNCYSTSSVGMQYAGQYIGGFVGYVRGNTDAAEVQEGEEDICCCEAVQHRFINCYAAGEVGGITTDVISDLNGSSAKDNFDNGLITQADRYYNYPTGGFMGYYEDMECYAYTPSGAANPSVWVKVASEEIMPVSLTNCYYDMQTTAMRERDVGGKGMYVENFTVEYSSEDFQYTKTFAKHDPIITGSNRLVSVDDSGKCLAGTLTGLTGVYTKSSKQKGVGGLTETDMGDSSIWANETDYYPQLISLTEAQWNRAQALAEKLKDTGLSDTERKILQMQYQRALDYYYCSLASTATVFLDHYDTVMTQEGSFEDAATTVYDTVRDITRKFTFTSTVPEYAAGTSVSWAANTEKNAANGFVSELKGADDAGISLTYENVLDSTGDDGTADYKASYIPKVVDIVLDEGTYKCVDFAPGKQWVSATLTGTSMDGGSISRSRDLRLLPKAYLNAGDMITVNVGASTDTSTDISLVTSDNTSVSLKGFYHYVGVAYAISDYIRMGTSTVFEGQTLTEYEYTEAKNTDTTSFAFYSGYLNSRYSTDVGLYSGDSSDGESDSKEQMYTQSFNTKQYNQSRDGYTMVKVFSFGSNSEASEGTLEVKDGSDLSQTGTNEVKDEALLKKFAGEVPFSSADAGYYVMRYYWRMDDGRWLQDDKLVYVSANDYVVEMVTGILGEEHVVDETQSNPADRTAIDQYVVESGKEKVYPSAAEEEGELLLNDNPGADNTGGFYKAELTGDSDLLEFTDRSPYNGTLLYDGNTYYTKTVSLTTSANSTEVGWRRSTDYKLTTLIVEVRTAAGEWEQMTRVLAEGENPEDYSNAVFEYQFKSTTITQDPITKVYSYETSAVGTPLRFKVSLAEAGDQDPSNIEQCIQFSLLSSDGDISVGQNIRVVALFCKRQADVVAEKYVLFGASRAHELLPETETSDESSDVSLSSYVSLKDYDAALSVDNNPAGVLVTDDDGSGSRYVFDSAADAESYAVAAGDTLTYRIRFQNIGYLDSQTVRVYDTVPEGCTFVDGSLKIYKQHKEVQDYHTIYSPLEECKQTYTSSDSGNSEELSPDSFRYEFSAEDNSIKWLIPSISTEDDYYVEYQVTVDQLPQSVAKSELTNTAIWSFISASGDMSIDHEHWVPSEEAGSNTHMVLAVSRALAAGESVDDSEKVKVEYSIYITPNVDLQEATITNYLPYGFKIDEDKIELAIEKGNAVNAPESIGVTVDDSTPDKVSFTLKSSYNSITLEKDVTYRLTFTGEQALLEKPGDYYNSSDEEPRQLVNKLNVVYKLTGEGEAEGSVYGNTISYTTRLTNEVSTDVTWLYLDIEKTIPADDPEQSFLFKVEKAEEDTAVDTTPLIAYTRINCTDENEDGTYTGTQRIRVARRGTYKVTEIADWSKTDYEAVAPVERLITLPDDTGVSGKKNMQVTSSNEESMAGAFPTVLGTAKETFPAAGFVNKESIYAYLSGQAYAENIFEKKADGEGDETQ